MKRFYSVLQRGYVYCPKPQVTGKFTDPRTVWQAFFS